MSIVLESKSAPNEATVESAFERILYAVLKDIGLSFSPQKEAPVKTRRHTAMGRMDSRIGALIIEYKQPSKLHTKAQQDSAIGQLANYSESLSIESESEIIGFLTDGTKILEIRTRADSHTIYGTFVSLDARQLDRLVRSIISLDKLALTASNLIRDFCGASFTGIVFQLACKLDNILSCKATPKTEMLRTEWESLFRLAHEDQSLQRRIQERRVGLSRIFNLSVNEAAMEYRVLFSLHTAYAIILKLIAYRVVSDVKLVLLYRIIRH